MGALRQEGRREGAPGAVEPQQDQGETGEDPGRIPGREAAVEQAAAEDPAGGRRVGEQAAHHGPLPVGWSRYQSRQISR